MTSRILVVDDDRDLRENLREVLSMAGFEVVMAANGEEALEASKVNPFDVVLLDMMMPGTSGMETLLLLKRQSPEVRVIMITAFATVENAVAAMRLGADDYISKPFKVNEMMSTVRRSLEEAKFRQYKTMLNSDNTFNCLANSIRRKILRTLIQGARIRFMDIVRSLNIDDHTKVNFHLKVLKDANIVEQRGKLYSLTREGTKVAECLDAIARAMSD